MLRPGLPLHCPNCGNNFISVQSTGADLLGTIVFVGNTEKCPRCKALVRSLDGQTVPTPAGTRFLPYSAPATRILVTNREETLKTWYFSAIIAGVKGPVWKIFVTKDDLYILCPSIPDWKISIHQSGSDNLSFTGEKFNYIKDESGIIGNRHIYKSTRHAPLLGHAVRVCWIDIELQSDETVQPNVRDKPKHIQKCKYIDFGSRRRATFELVYTEGPASNYDQTCFLIDQSVASFSLADAEFFYLRPVYDSAVGRQYEIDHSSSVAMSRRSQSKIEFGISPRNVFLVKVLI